MTTRTPAGASHYHVQKNRRATFIEDWRNNHRDVVAVGDVALHRTRRGHRVGVYVGVDGDRPTRTMDAFVHEFEPGTSTTIHRHSWDALVFVVAGWGWTEIDGQRVHWGPGDSLHIPAWAWHRSGNDGTATADTHRGGVGGGGAGGGGAGGGEAGGGEAGGGEAGPDSSARYLTFSSGPMLDTMGMAVLEDAGRTPLADLPGRPAFTADLDGDDPYARRVRRLGREQRARRAGRLHTSWDDLELVNTPRGTRTTFLVDRAIGYQASGITMAMFEIGPGRAQSMHRHPGEAWLYVVEGSGHTYLGTEPEGGAIHRWKKGDLIIVDHFLWHQHFNDDPGKTAKVVRIHMFDSLLETMRALCDPLVLFEEPPTHIRDQQAGDPTTVEWPALQRPTWP